MKQDYLEKEIISEISQRSIIKLICLTVLLTFLINAIFYFYLKSNTPNLGYEINIKKWDILNKMNEKKDWLILGDSTCNQGFFIPTLEERTHMNAVNLCTIGDMLTIGDSWMLETYINKLGTPKNVLIIHAYDVWMREDINLSLASQLPIWNLLKEKPKPWDLSTKEEVILIVYKYFPLYSQKESLIDILAGLLKKNDDPDRTFDKNGFMTVKYADIQSVVSSRNNHATFLKNHKFNISSKNLLGLDNIKNLSKKYDFNVFIANSPININLSKNSDFQSYVSDMEKYLSDYVNRDKNMHYINKIYAFPDDKMVSSDHVNIEAAIEYSKNLSDDIKDLL